MFMRNHGRLVSGMVLCALLLAACGAPSGIPATPGTASTQPPRVTEPPTAEPTVAVLEPTTTPAPTEPPTAAPTVAAPEPTTVAAAAPVGVAEAGKKAWAARSCRYCHGDAAEGIGAPKLAGTALTWDEILAVVRDGRPGTQMQQFKASIISDQELADIYAWLKSQ